MVAANQPPPYADGTSAHDAARVIADVLTMATNHHDLAGVCSGVATSATGLPGVTAAGVLVRSASGDLVPIGTAAQEPQLLDLLEAGAGSPVATHCLTTCEPVVVEGLDGTAAVMWGALGELAQPLGVGATYALPLAAGATAVGVLHLLAASAVPSQSLLVGKSLADVATLALLSADPTVDGAVVTRRIHLAIEARITIEQAKGVLAARYTITPGDAFDRLVRAAAAKDRPLGSVATAVVERTTDGELDGLLSGPRGE